MVDDDHVSDADCDTFRIELPMTVEQRMQRKQQRYKRAFLKGPVPMVWLRRAMEIEGTALAVALVLRFYHGLRREPDAVNITYAKLGEQCPRCKRSIQRGLQDLVNAGLVTVERPPGRMLQVRLIDVIDDDGPASLGSPAGDHGAARG